MNEADRIRLRHMLDAAREALAFAKGRIIDHLAEDRMFLLASVKAVEIVGEAANRISDETRLKLPGVPWRKLVGMRNRLIHAYSDVDLAVVWATITVALPQLVHEMEKGVEMDAPEDR